MAKLLSKAFPPASQRYVAALGARLRSHGEPLQAGCMPQKFYLGSREYANAAAATAEVETETVLFPRVDPGISYGLNWALAAKGVPPKDKVFRNLTDTELHKHQATASEEISASSIFIHGNSVAGASSITKSQFNKLLKQVQSYMSSKSELFVHDGAVGSFPIEDVRVRSICDDASGALAIKKILCRAPVRDISAEAFPLTIYAASAFGSSALEQLGFPSKVESSFAVADHEQSALILGGKIFNDVFALKSALAAVAAPTILSKGALPLSARILIKGDLTVLLFAPESVIQACPTILETSVTKDANSTWSAPGGLAAFFASADGQAPNLFKAPSSVILVTVDSSGVLPSMSQLSPGQATYHFLAGYNGKCFSPMYQEGSSSLDPLSLAKQLLAKLSSSETPAYLVNASEGKKIMSGKELLKLIEASISQKPPTSKGKASAEAVEALKGHYSAFISKRFSELPEGCCF